MTSGTGEINCVDGNLAAKGRGVAVAIEPGDVTRILSCRMADEAHHGAEDFHIVERARDFVLIGPFVGGALGAIDDFRAANPAIPVERWRVTAIPWRYREGGPLGLRLYPIAGLAMGPLADLEGFGLTAED